MVLSKEELDKFLSGIHDELQGLYKEKKLEAILDHYHPDAVVINSGKFSKYGKDEVKSVINEYLATTGDFKAFPTKRESTSDGEFLIEAGHFEVKQISGETFKACYETIYKRKDGKYFVYHDLYASP